MVLITAGCGFCQDVNSGKAGEDELNFDDVYFSGKSVELTEKEQQAITLADAWQQGEIIAHNPVVGQDGSVEFLLDAERPSIVCAVMQLTDIELQPGEKVLSVNLGDSVRWHVQPGVSSGDTMHILVRPRDVGLDTSMVVMTDRRTYRLRLRSHRHDYMPHVRFAYPDNLLATWEKAKSDAEEKRKIETMPDTNERLGDLDFAYTIKGKARWKPIRVYNNSVKTFIEMPKSMTQTEAPVLMNTRKNGRILKKQEMSILNYVLEGRRFIVDSVFDEAVLIAGVGADQERITITRNPKAGE